MDLGFDLTTAQDMAASHLGGPMLVLAGPGSGKTSVIVHRVSRLAASGVDASKILAITFSKAAAEEMGRRNLAQGGPREAVFCTFHSFFYKVLRTRWDKGMDKLLSEEGSLEILKQAAKSAGLSFERDALVELLQGISAVKGDLARPETYSCKVGKDNFPAFYYGYENLKDAAGLWDFDDMLVKCLELFESEPKTLGMWQERHPWLLIDEFQDINRAQYNCIKLLAGKRKNVFAVGDDDQSIYGFRGAKPEFLLSFTKDFPAAKKVVLDINHRSTTQIISCSNVVISDNKTRMAKVMKGAGPTGPAPKLMGFSDQSDEAKGVCSILRDARKQGTAWSDMAVLYRVGISTRAYQEALASSNIPFQSRDSASIVYEHWVTKDILTYLMLSQGSTSADLYARIMNKPSRYITNVAIGQASANPGSFMRLLKGACKSYQVDNIQLLEYDLSKMSKQSPSAAIKFIRASIGQKGYDSYIKHLGEYKGMETDGWMEILAEIEDMAKLRDNIPDFLDYVAEATRRARDSSKQKFSLSEHGGVFLSTLHGAKGLEFDTVVIANAIDGMIPHKLSLKDPDALEEERRVLYVGMTRAKRNLFITHPKEKNGKPATVSRFLSSLSGNTKSREKKRVPRPLDAEN
ncbi:MAG: ATP-dependent helicase [Clostridiales bacterium]|nr:ATP-dependent helicase [Clostridiales bacterium]